MNERELKHSEAEACGRVNLIGEHTDYNQGYVLPILIPQKTKVRLTKRRDKRVLVQTLNMNEVRSAEYVLGQESKQHSWIDYLQGVTRELENRNFKLEGFDAEISSDIPLGSGLSSSAALEVSLLRALRTLFEMRLSDVEIALIGQEAENSFVGARVGIMDQMASSLAHFGEAFFLDTRDLSYTRIALPLRLMDIAVIHSGVSHDHSVNEYNKRRAECEEGAQILGVKSFRDLELKRLGEYEGALPRTLFRRVRHVLSENSRVIDAVQALESQDFELLGRLLNASHLSLRDDYQVSVPEVDSLVEAAQSLDEVWGARMSGGGFGGSIVILCKPELSHRAIEETLKQHRTRFPESKARPVVASYGNFK